MKFMRVAAIDIGTLTCRLLIGDVDGHWPGEAGVFWTKDLAIG